MNESLPISKDLTELSWVKWAEAVDFRASFWTDIAWTEGCKGSKLRAEINCSIHQSREVKKLLGTVIGYTVSIKGPQEMEELFSID